MQISREYFHLIRHPRSGAQERGKLLTALAILSCITVLIPAGFGIAYLIGRIKQGAKNPKVSQAASKVFHHSPIGFPQYGNSCWMAAGMQALLSSEHLESLLRKELEPTKNETNEELLQRKTVQKALIALVEAYKRGETHKALKEFHQSLLHLPDPQKLTHRPKNSIYTFPSPGTRSDPLEILALIEGAFPGDMAFWGEFANRLHGPHDLPNWGQDFAPKILVIGINGSTAPHPIIQANTPLNYFKRQYRIVGAIQGLPNHSTAFVRRGNDWHLCDDGRVRLASLENTTYESLNITRLVLDLIEKN